MDQSSAQTPAPLPKGGDLPDAAPRNWLDLYAPEWLKPYGRLARWDRPIGCWLLLWPCWWSLALASAHAGHLFPSPFYLALFLIGSIAMRGAGCTYNDLVDRDIDAKVARTAARPIASGQISVKQALIFIALQCFVGLLVLIQFNFFTILLGFGSLVVVAAYPFMKRITDWPQLVLGLAFSWGGLVGWSAEFGSLHPAAFALYAAAILWTIGYDTIYALQDKEDDALVGVRSTARLFGDKARLAIGIFYLLSVLAFAIAFALAGTHWIVFIGLFAIAVQFFWQAVTLDISDSDNCLQRFRSNGWAGWLVFAGLIGSAWM